MSINPFCEKLRKEQDNEWCWKSDSACLWERGCWRLGEETRPWGAADTVWWWLLSASMQYFNKEEKDGLFQSFWVKWKSEGDMPTFRVLRGASVPVWSMDLLEAWKCLGTSAFVRPSCEGWRHLTWTHNVIEAGGKKRTAHMRPRRLVAIASHCISPLLSIQKLPSLHRPDTAQSWTGSALVFVHACLEFLPFESGRLSWSVTCLGKASLPCAG